MDAHTAAFIAVAAVLVMTPGADFAVLIRNALRGRREGMATSAGTVTGALCTPVPRRLAFLRCWRRPQWP
jgi:threonine/homoserine/homoserine lactone efflux protein